jgi:flagellar assembly protein FliH
MSREVLSNQDYQYSPQGYLVDNTAWQEEIKRRLAEELKKGITEPRPTLNPDEFQPYFLPENPEAVETVQPAEPVPTAEEIAERTKLEAEEQAKEIEQTAKKKAYEEIEQARWEANEIITKAKEDAEKEVLALKDAAGEEGRKTGFEKGQQEGVEKGRVEGQQSYAEALKKWNHVLEETTAERKKLLGEMQPILVELVGEALHRCLAKEAKRHHEMVLDFAQEVIKKAQDQVHLKMHLNPEDVEEVEAQKEQLQLSVGAGELELVPDARIERGGCVLETEAGSVDARLSTVVDQVKESLSQGLSLNK